VREDRGAAAVPRGGGGALLWHALLSIITGRPDACLRLRSPLSAARQSAKRADLAEFCSAVALMTLVMLIAFSLTLYTIHGVCGTPAPHVAAYLLLLSTGP
jgi:hypothetical protein